MPHHCFGEWYFFSVLYICKSVLSVSLDLLIHARADMVIFILSSKRLGSGVNRTTSITPARIASLRRAIEHVNGLVHRAQ